MTTAAHLLTVALTGILTVTPTFAGGNRGTPPTPPTCATQPVVPVTTPLTTPESATLAFMREEERLARDVYAHFDTLWQVPPFAGISESEQSHADAIKRMMDRYSVADPSDPTVVGVFADATVQGLYDSLTVKGEASLLEALKVGGLIEETDIDDLENAIAATTNDDLLHVYNELLRGSRNHLRAFVSEIERQGGDAYTAQHLTQEEVDAIVTTPMERGGNGGGRGAGGAGNGAGNGGRGAGGMQR